MHRPPPAPLILLVDVMRPRCPIEVADLDEDQDQERDGFDARISLTSDAISARRGWDAPHLGRSGAALADLEFPGKNLFAG